MLKDGIYVDLPIDEYHADLALGSTNIKALLKSAAHYWNKSPLNKNNKEKTTPAREFGSALHKFILEGENAFFEAYALKTASGVTKEGRAEKQKAQEEGKKLISNDDLQKIKEAQACILANPSTKSAFTGGMPEVSFFWTRADGIRCKARFDYLKYAAIVDLKSLSNAKGFAINKAAYHALAEYDYLLSAAWYLKARSQMKNLIEKGLTFSATPQQLQFLQQCAANAGNAFVWVFYQTVDEPSVYGIAADGGNQAIFNQEDSIEIAISRYKAALGKFGTQKPWNDQQERLDNLDYSNLPSWYRSEKNDQ